MTRLRLRVVQGQPLRPVRLSDVPEFIRHKYIPRVYDAERADGKRGYALLAIMAGATAAARKPSDRVYWVAEAAWQEMLAEAARLERSGQAERHLAEARAAERRVRGKRRYVLDAGKSEIRRAVA